MDLDLGLQSIEPAREADDLDGVQRGSPIRRFLSAKGTERASRFGISRVDREEKSYHGWAVAICRRGEICRKFFADVLHGGRKRALRAAMNWRDEMLDARPALSRKDFSSILRRSNRSGVPGVCRVFESTKSGGKVEHWIAFWPTTSGKSRRAKYSIGKYGEDFAFELAKARRQAELEKLADEERIVSDSYREWLQERQP